MAPLMPQGTYWWSGPAAGGVQYPGAAAAALNGWPWHGAQPLATQCWVTHHGPVRCLDSADSHLSPFLLPPRPHAGAGSKYRTRRNPWSGVLGRPGNEYQDSLSALSDLDQSFYTGFHTFGVDWRPGEVRAGGVKGVAAGVAEDASLA